MSELALTTDLEPGLLSESQLRSVLQKKGIENIDGLIKHELVNLYMKYVQPQPQRLRKPNNRSRNTQINSDNKKNINDANNANKQIPNSMEIQPVTPTVASNPEPPKPKQKIILKRTHLASSHSSQIDSGDEIKKPKLTE